MSGFDTQSLDNPGKSGWLVCMSTYVVIRSQLWDGMFIAIHSLTVFEKRSEKVSDAHRSAHPLV